MKVLYFSRDYTTHDRRFLAKLARTDHEIYYMRLENDAIQYESRPIPEGIQLVDWAGGHEPCNSPEEWFKLIPDYERVLNELHPDIIHAGPIQSCGFMTAVTGFSPFLLMSWGSDILIDSERNDLFRWMTSYALRRSDMFACDALSVRSKAKSLIPYPDHRIVQFPWGVDLDHFTSLDGVPALRKRLGWISDFVIISTRAWEPIYDIEVLLSAFASAYRTEKSLRLLLLGTGTLASRINKFIEEQGLQDVIYTAGQVSQDNMPEYFGNADLYISCSQSDGSSLSLLEAMAMSLPVIVSDIDSNREWVVPGENGWLAPVGDVSAFAGAISEAANSQEKQTRMSMSNRNTVEEKANWDNNFALLLDTYEKLHLMVKGKNEYLEYK